MILVKAPEPNFIEGVKNELAEIKDSATAAINGRSATEYVSCVEKMTAMYSKGQGHARMSKVLGGAKGQGLRPRAAMPFSHMRRLASKVKGAISDPAGFLEKELKLSAVDKLELCLVCEVCWRPQRKGAYNVTTQSDLCAKVRA